MNFLHRLIMQASSNCIYCGRELLGNTKDDVCDECDVVLNSLRNKNFNNPFYVFKYKGIVKKLVYRYKYDDRAHLALYIAQEMLNVYKKNDINADVITYIPVHKKRLKERGFDQSESIAIYFCTLLNTQCARLLKRVINTSPQYSLNLEDRKENVADAFELLNENIYKKNVLLIDDIYTTGATANECIKLLTQAGANVMIFTFAKDFMD